MILASFTSQGNDDLVMHQCQGCIESGCRHPGKLGHLEVSTDTETVTLGMLLIVLVRKHTTEHINCTVERLGRCSAHWESRSQLLFDEFTLSEIEQI